MLKRFWLGLAQTITMLVFALFIVKTLKPQWLPVSWSSFLSFNKSSAAYDGKSPIQTIEAPSNVAGLSYHDAVKNALPSVVRIYTINTAVGPVNNDGYNPEVSGSLGSGVIIDAQGYIVTNNHVVEGATEITVVFNDGTRTQAKLIGADPDTDLAVLHVTSAEPLKAITVGYDAKLQIGDVVLAIGNPRDIGQSVTMGIVSATNRSHMGISTFENFIQTDAAINQGNSGGALVDSNGYLVGINTAILTGSKERDSNDGIGFAIPVSTVTKIANSLITTGEVARGFIGVTSQSVTPEIAKAFNLADASGVVIASVRAEGPAEAAGLMVGDVLVQVNENKVTDTATMLSEIADLDPGATAVLKVIRKGQEMNLNIVIGKRPSATQVPK
ncbi:MAG: trypsin-like peptidase domain-containing protein [Formosimonas sp.]|jgi:serine protease DegQ